MEPQTVVEVSARNTGTVEDLLVGRGNILSVRPIPLYRNRAIIRLVQI